MVYYEHMGNSFIEGFFSPQKASFWFFCGSVFFALIVGALIFGFSPLIAPAMVIILAALSFLHKPFILLGILVTVRMSTDYLSETIRFSFNDQFSLSLSQMLGIFLLCISLALFIIYRKHLLAFPLWKPFALLISFGFIASAFSTAPLLGFQEVARLISIFAISFLAYISIANVLDVKKIFLLLLFSSFIPIAETVRQLFLGIGMSDSSFDVLRIFGTFSHTNVLALYLYSLCVVIVMILLSAPQLKIHWAEKKPVLFAYGLLLLFLLAMTYTRVAWIALFLFVFILALWRYRKLLMPILIIPIILFSASSSIRERVIESFETNPDSSILWRQGLWHDVTTELRMDHKQYFGTGLDTFSAYAENLRGIRFGSTDAHNDFIKFYVEGGLLGLIVFVIYILFLAKEIRHLFTLPKEYRDLAFIFSLYAATLLLCSFSENIYKDTPIQWFFFILFGALLALKQRTLKSSAP